MENRDYQKIAKVVAHKRFGKVWELDKGYAGVEKNGNQYAIRSSNSFFLAENYPPFTELYYNDFSNSYVLASKKSESSLLVASVKAEKGVKIWDTQSGPLKPLLEGKQLVIKNGNDLYDANNYALGKQLVIDKMTMTMMVVGENFKVALMLDDGKGLQNRNIQKVEFSAAEISKVQLLHTDGAEGEMPNQNYEEASKVLELIGALEAEGVEPQNVAICSPYKNQLLVYEEELKNSLPPQNLFSTSQIPLHKRYEYTIISISAFQGNGLMLKNLHVAIKKLLKQSETLIIAGNIEFLFEKNSQLALLLQSAYENGQVIEI